MIRATAKIAVKQQGHEWTPLIVLEMSREAGHLKEDDTAILVSFGSGLAMLALHFHLPKGVEGWS